MKAGHWGVFQDEHVQGGRSWALEAAQQRCQLTHGSLESGWPFRKVMKRGKLGLDFSAFSLTIHCNGPPQEGASH